MNKQISLPILKLALAQLNLSVGNINGNRDKIISAAQYARDQLQANVIVFHELAISNYSPEDLLYHQDFYQAVEVALQSIAQNTHGIDVIIGYPQASGAVADPQANTRFNSAAWLRAGKIIANYHKQHLPNYGIFDDKRYFTAGKQTTIIELQGIKIGLLICEDLWHSQPIKNAKEMGAELIVSLNASPFSSHKQSQRLKMLQQRAQDNKLAIVYVNQIGLHDELLYDGNSMVIDSQGQLCCQLPTFAEAIQTVTIKPQKPSCYIQKEVLAPPAPSPEALIYQALVLATRDYLHKNNFKKAIVALSGGIDSALTLAIAVDALGKEQVTSLFMPSRHTASISYQAVDEEVAALGNNHHQLSIDDTYETLHHQLQSAFVQPLNTLTDQNIQARIRGLLVMGFSNQNQQMVLTTGNKSEMAVGYATLYGDMAGGFAVLKDVYKTMVYKLARYRNQLSMVIPQIVLDRPPSAELAPQQLDQDNLPPYDILDKILQQYIECNGSIDKIIAQGFDSTTVNKVVKMVVGSEYKRRQSPPGPRVSNKSFGRDWRYPISSPYPHHSCHTKDNS